MEKGHDVYLFLDTDNVRRRIKPLVLSTKESSINAENLNCRYHLEPTEEGFNLYFLNLSLPNIQITRNPGNTPKVITRAQILDELIALAKENVKKAGKRKTGLFNACLSTIQTYFSQPEFTEWTEGRRVNFDVDKFGASLTVISENFHGYSIINIGINYVAKVGDDGICHVISQGEKPGTRKKSPVQFIPLRPGTKIAVGNNSVEGRVLRTFDLKEMFTGTEHNKLSEFLTQQKENLLVIM